MLQIRGWESSKGERLEVDTDSKLTVGREKFMIFSINFDGSCTGSNIAGRKF
jgi:phosphoribosylformimino-5-aminoimidazole carboxamide ribonucleotide (ProFAR) isomerase